ncbi:Hint domain-containing protein [Pontivivens nitratireducens]|nr:Hint domain-containing protein [Pontibrevibacter nitratireducens]
MALLDVDLLANNEVIIDQNNADSTNTVNITALGNGTLIVDGVEVTIISVAGVSAGANATFETINNATLNIDQGLLAVSALTSTTYKVGDSSTVNLDASGIDLGALSTLLNADHNVEFSGENHTGTFSYDPPIVSLVSALDPITFNTTGMQSTDMFVVEGKTLSLDTTLTGGPSSAYRGGVLHLETGGGLLTPKVHVTVPMTQNEFNMFLSNQGIYLNGDTFTFPGEIVCFGRGTLILTICGDVAVEDLREGDLVMTRDHGAQPIRWIGSHYIGTVILNTQPNLHPIRISAGALGQNAPAQDLIVSPQHRVLVRSKIAQRMFGAIEILVAAKHLLELDGINIADDLVEVEYYHMLFDQHEVITSNGVKTESLYTGPEAIKSIGAQALREIYTLFSELRDRDYSPVPARMLLSGRQGRQLAGRHTKNNRAMLM